VPYAFECYGLRALSEIPLNAVESWTAHVSDADVCIERGPIEDGIFTPLEEANYVGISDNRVLLTLQDVGRIEVTAGRRVIADLAPDCAHALFEAYLLGTVFGTIIHQRREFPLHASIVGSEHGAVAFTAPSGAGKSTLAASLAVSGLARLLSDDMSRLSIGTDGAYTVSSGPPRLKLRDDSSKRLGLSAHQAQSGNAIEDKRLYFDSPSEWISEAPLRALIYIRRARDNEVSLQRVHGDMAIRVALAAIFRPSIGCAIQGERSLFLRAAIVASRVRIYKLSRPWGIDCGDRIVRQLRREGLL